MWVRVLGSAAGGGSPQWNCGCEVCAAVRSGAARPRTQSSIAVSIDRRRWFLFNASPDVHTQVGALLPKPEALETPVQSVLLTDAELDHSLGLLLLREAPSLRLYATPAVHKTLSDGSGLLRLLERYCSVEWTPVIPGVSWKLTEGLSCSAFDVKTTKKDRFGLGLDQGRVVGYRLTEERSGRTMIYLPGAQSLPEDLQSDCLLIDGTCWQDDELIRLGRSAKSSRAMGHLPVQESLGPLADPNRRTIYVHLNNTNPILLHGTPERRAVEEAGLEVAFDGLEVEV
jgi:pyrroloquinoline quinone biosynthesis protein B